jgi:transcriptional regulator with XRE-family HTH domain
MLERDGMSQSALAIEIDRNVSHLNSILNGRVNPTIEVLINVAKFYKITLDELLFTDMAAEKK